MRMPFSASERSPVAGLLCLMLALSVAGCASKNPLMDDEPVVVKKSSENPDELALKLSRKAQVPAQAPAPAATPAPAAATAPAPATAPTVAPVTAEAANDPRINKPTGLRRFLGILKPYRVDVQQGNFVTREMVDQLREGMQRPEGVTREQVRFVLGTPLLTDVFHNNRWDYVFRLQKKTGEVISSRITAIFENNRLARIEGDELPTEQEYLAYISGSEPGANTKIDKK
jgi:outer membrane protein assembly factor BamE